MNRKTTPTARKTIRKNTSPGMRTFLAVLAVQFLPARKAGVQLVPVGDFRLVHPPAEINFTAVLTGAEIDQAGQRVLELDLELVELFEMRADLILEALDLRLDRFDVAAAARFFHTGESPVLLAQAMCQRGDIAQNEPKQ